MHVLAKSCKQILTLLIPIVFMISKRIAFVLYDFKFCGAQKIRFAEPK